MINLIQFPAILSNVYTKRKRKKPGRSIRCYLSTSLHFELNESFYCNFLRNPENFFHISHLGGWRDNIRPSLEASCIPSSLCLGITRAMCLQCLTQGRLSIHTFSPARWSGIQHKRHGQHI